MKGPDIWPGLLPMLRMNFTSGVRSLLLGLLASALTAIAEFVSVFHTFLSQGIWFRKLGLPVEWIGILRSSDATSFLDLRILFYLQAFLQNLLFWTVICFSLVYIWKTLRDNSTLSLVPLYVLGLASARIQLELQMAIAAKGGFLSFARIDPFSSAQISAYFAMALLLFPAIITVVSRLPFLDFFKLSSLGLPIILMPPTVDYYILRQPVIYNFFTSEYYQQARGPLEYLSILSPGIKLEIVFVATLTSAYLVYRTRSVLRAAVAIIVVVFAFSLVSTPALTSRLHLGLQQPQLFAGYLLITYVLTIIGFGLARPGMGSAILGRIRIRGIHFPSMALFGAFLAHPTILVAGVPEDFGLIIAAVFIVFLVWQTATIFDDICDSKEKAVPSGYWAYGVLIGLMALLAAIPFGLAPWILTVVAVYLAMDYPRLRRRHYLLSGITIGLSTSIAFLFGTLVPLTSEASPQPIALFALAVFVIFSGGSLLKDIVNVEEDKRLGIPTIFTRFEKNRPLPIVAGFVALGFAIPSIFFGTMVDFALFLGAGVGAWLLIMILRDRCYRPILILYFLEGIWVFFRLFYDASGSLRWL